MEWLKRLRYRIGMFFFGRKIMNQAYKMSMGDAIDALIAELETDNNIVAAFSHSHYADKIYKTLMTNPFVLVLNHDDKTMVKDASQNWHKFLGWGKVDLINKSFMDFVHPDDFKETKSAAHNPESITSSELYYNRYKCKHRTSYSFNADGREYIWLAWQTNVQHKETEKHRISIAKPISPTDPMFLYLQQIHGNFSKKTSTIPSTTKR